MSTPESRKDAFAQIGTLQAVANRELVEQEPVVSQRVFLPSGDEAIKTPSRGFKSVGSGEDEVEAHLEELKRRKRPYLENHVPVQVSGWPTREFKQFSWQIEGAEKWEAVELPHYGEPVGPAVTCYTTRFTVDYEREKSGIAYLSFTSVDYRCEVYLNGQYVGSHEGFFSPFAFEAEAHLRDGENELKIRVLNDYCSLGRSQHQSAPDIDGDKLFAATNQGYDDPQSGWHHCPPGMGIPGQVFLEFRPATYIEDVFIRPLQSLDAVEVWVEVFHRGIERTQVQLDLGLYGENFPQTVFGAERLWDESFTGNHPQSSELKSLEAGPGRSSYRFTIPLAGARLWTPDTPWLYQAQVSMSGANGAMLDQRARTFGMRWFALEERDGLEGMPYLNGSPIRLRGANTMGHEQRAVMEGNDEQLLADVLLAQACYMNFFRFTQRPVQEKVYALCDRLGMLTQTDLPLFGYLRRNQFVEAVRQAQEMERMVRSHPCNILISYINEPFPDSWAKRSHRHLIRHELESFFIAASHAVHLENPDRVIKPVDGDYAPPAQGLPDNHCYNLWYLGHGIDPGKLHKGYWQEIKPGWHYGCGEFGAEGIDTRELMERLCPPDWLPGDTESEADWTPERIPFAQAWKFGTLFFDIPKSVDGWIRRTREHQAWAMGFMMEAFRRDPRNVSSAIHLFIDAWPTGWMKTIVDVERRPKPAYYAYREALKPLKLSLRTDRNQLFSGDEQVIDIWVCNDTNLEGKGRVEWTLMVEDFDSVQEGSFDVSIEDCRPIYAGSLKLPLPKVDKRSRAQLSARLIVEDTVVHEACSESEVFPAVAPEIGQGGFFADPEDPAFSHGSVSLSPEAYKRDPEKWDSFVREGGRLLLINWPQGEYEVASAAFRIVEASMTPRYFVSRGTGHPLVQAFREKDFSWWYEPETDRPGPLAATAIEAEGWESVLTTTNHGWEVSKRPHVDVACLRKVGQGDVVLCQIPLETFMRHNPVALEFAHALRGAPVGHPRDALAQTV